MVLLLDTCTLIWLCQKPTMLSERATLLLDDNDNALTVSDVSVWEICLKTQSGKLQLPRPLEPWFREQKKLWRFSVLSIKTEHVFRSSQLELIHRDPFDRLLVSQSLVERIPILTPDEYIGRYPAEVIW